MAVVSDKVTEKPVSGNPPAVADKRAGLSAAYDYYPFGMQMPGRVVEDATVQCIPVTKYRKVDGITESQNVLTIANLSAPDYNWWIGTAGSTTVTALPQSPGYQARLTSSAGVTTLDGKLTFNALPADASGFIVDVTFTSNDHPSITGLDRICVGAGTLGVELRNLSTASGAGTFLIYATRTGPGTIRLTVPPGMVSAGNVIRLWQHYDAGPVSTFCHIGYTPQAQITYTSVVRNVLKPVDQQYVVLSCDTDGAYTAGYRYGFNGQQKDDEVAGKGNSLSYEARTYDSRLGRWLSTDPLANKYPSTSTYVFGLNTPIVAKDPDGNVVIFINGIHAGTGGTAAYWEGYDQKVMDILGDHSARYVDGALGGWKNTGGKAIVGGISGILQGWIGSLTAAAFSVLSSSNVNMKVRMEAGRAQGKRDAAAILAKLKDGETVKIVTHSMGTAFGRGYTQGFMEVVNLRGLSDKVRMQYELDINAFQGGDLPADPNVEFTQNKTGGLDGGTSPTEALKFNSVPTVGKVPGAEDITDPSDANKGHAIKPMSTSKIPKLGHGGNPDKIEEGNNNERAK